MSPMSGFRQQLKMLGTALLGKRTPKSVKKKPFTDVELAEKKKRNFFAISLIRFKKKLLINNSNTILWVLTI
ncbi:hypothetical protein DOY81_002025 [Sarcophaga bullata]|nr:hypothetical protein DOY81_002025 [Sarcophaga bullata]